jgi:hypothetical protein
MLTGPPDSQLVYDTLTRPASWVKLGENACTVSSRWRSACLQYAQGLNLAATCHVLGYCFAPDDSYERQFPLAAARLRLFFTNRYIDTLERCHGI